MALLVSVFLSLFLARTIVNPLRLLVRAAVRVRLGREREVVVPRLPERRDEIGLLARAFSDMTTALRQRIDEQRRANTEFEKTVETTRAEAATRLAAGRNRLLVLHGRRSPGDKEWIVTMVNPTLLKIDPPHPLAQEWASGRDYLVFARTEHEARDRAMRRFSTRPGAAIRSVAPAAHDLFHG